MDQLTEYSSSPHPDGGKITYGHDKCVWFQVLPAPVGTATLVSLALEHHLKGCRS